MIAGNFHTVNPNAAIIPVGRIINRKTGEVTRLLFLEGSIKQFEKHQNNRVHTNRLFACSQETAMQLGLTFPRSDGNSVSSKGA